MGKSAVNRRARLIALFVLILALPAQAPIPASQFASFAFRQHPGARLPLDAELQDEKGRTVRLGSYFGSKPVVLVLEYLHCPNLCGLVLRGVTAQMKQQGLEPGRDLEFVSVSIDPRETAADATTALSNYTRSFGAKSTVGWHFLRGPPDKIRQIADAVGFPYRFDPTLNQYAHPAGFVVATPDGRIAQYLLGLQQPKGEMRNAIDSAATGATKPPAYPLLCLCLGYDPQPGTVAAIVLGTVRTVSVAILAACILLVLLLAGKRRPA